MVLLGMFTHRGVDLTGHHMGHSIIDGLAGYIVWAAAVTEVQVDVLTGMTNIRRLDFIEDTGMATSPAVDLGQVEGALVMGLGLWTSEQVMEPYPVHLGLLSTALLLALDSQ